MAKTTEQKIKELENDLKSVQESLDQLKEQHAQEQKVGRQYAKVPCRQVQDHIWARTNTELLDHARDNAAWLEQKVINQGPGAASDSGEAYSVAYIRELSKRLAAKS